MSKLRVGNALEVFNRLDNINRASRRLALAYGVAERKAAQRISQMLLYLEEHVLDSNFNDHLSLIISKFKGYSNPLVDSVRLALVSLQLEYIRTSIF